MVGQASMLLLDSGAQYEDGTTDVTRTMHFGEPTAEQKEVKLRSHFSANFQVYFLVKRRVGLHTMEAPATTVVNAYCLVHLIGILL